MKLIGNAFILGSEFDSSDQFGSRLSLLTKPGLELIAETQTLADKSGVGAEQLDSFLNGTSRYFVLGLT